MESSQKVNQELNSAAENTEQQLQEDNTDIFKKFRGGFFVILGYLLSPLCWWNDLVFNLPIAYGFGYVCSLFSANWLMPGSIIGYWISNVVGILMMQFGSQDIFQKEPKERNLKKELLSGLISSTVYTLIIVALIQWKILDVPDLFSNG
ncbi:hypothetical protein [Anabaena subtropica]|uniref:SxtJ n=1 Tax=Anabaena subtropica FACHB-260 TaxID=2692884 RepID=A0ABR8CT00_9NOST|nr:hypothetical protein [Anabaena subtropica]MBD2346013.1 hypothetical protein [Anabaena subtropica FACHB-260]